MLIFGLFTMFYCANILKIIEFLHLASLKLIGYINVWTHGFVSAMTCPFHYHLWRNSHSQCITDESSSSCMCPNKCMFRANDVNTVIPLVICLSDGLINFCNHTQLMNIVVKSLVTYDRQGFLFHDAPYFDRIYTGRQSGFS